MFFFLDLFEEALPMCQLQWLGGSIDDTKDTTPLTFVFQLWTLYLQGLWIVHARDTLCFPRDRGH